jgi:hypothetical protein
MAALTGDQTTSLKELMKGKENFWFESCAIIIAYNENGFKKKNGRFVMSSP